MTGVRVRRAGSLAVLTVLVLSGCQPTGVAAAPPPGAIVIIADRIAFEQASLVAPAGQAFDLWLDNRDAVPHNVRVVAGSGASIATGEVFTGPAALPLSVPSLAAGTYKLLCDVHPEMLAALVAH